MRKLFTNRLLSGAFILSTYFLLSLPVKGQGVIVVSNDTTICPGANDTLRAFVSMAAPPTVTVYSEPPTVGPISMSDDAWFGGPTAVNIGFNFIFFGTIYNQLYIGSNSIVTFTNPASTFCPWSITNAWPTNLPPIVNAIGCPYQDLQPPVPNYGFIRSALIGTAPNRVFVIDWFDVPFYSCNSTCATQQIKLFETTNEVQVHITQRNICPTWNGGYGIEGIINATGTNAYVPPGRNYPSSWTCSNDGYSWIPTSPASYAMAPCTYSPAYLGTFSADSVQWYVAGSPIVIGTGDSLPIHPLVTTTYVAKVNFAGTCNAPQFSDTVVITVAPPVDAGPGQVVCVGGTTTLHATPGGTNYQWTPMTGLLNPLDSITSATPAVTTNYTVSANIGGCVTSDTMTVTVNTAAVMNITPVNPIICAGSSVTLTGSGAQTYTWSPGTGLSATTGDSVIATPAGTTAYNVAGTAPGCPPMSANVTVTVNPLPVITFTPPSPVSLCAGFTQTLSAASTITGTTFTWAPTTGLTTSSGANTTFNGTTTTTYTVSSNAAGCIVNPTMVVNVNALPTINWPVPFPNNFCQSDLPFALFGASGSPAGGIGAYSGPGVTAGIFSPSQILAPPGVGVPSTLTFTYTDANGCIDSAHNTYTVTGNPTVTVTSAQNPVCFNSPAPIQLTGTPSGPGGSYTGTGIAAGGSTFTPTPAAGVASAGTYDLIYQYVDPVSNCTGKDTVQEVVWPLPTPAITGLNPKYCVVDPIITLTGTPPPSSPTGGSFTVDGATATTIDPATQLGSHTVVYTFTDANGCTDLTTQNTVVNPLPVVSFSGLNPTYCQYDPIATLSGNPSGVTGVFSGNAVSANTFDPATASVGNNTLTYTYMDPLTLCTNSSSNSTEVYQTPHAGFAISPLEASILNPVVTFTDQSLLADSWLWNFGDLTDSSIVHNPVHTFGDTGIYVVRLVITNHGCLDTITESVHILPDYNFTMPSAFTPNGDNHNDTFGPYAIGIADFHMVIFDRWGNQLFSSNNINSQWDGSNAPQGVYIYRINSVDYFGQPYEYMGHLSLIR